MDLSAILASPPHQRLLPVNKFLDLGRRMPVIDVRSPDEFMQGHIPGAHLLPLLNDDERAAVGTLYKQESRDAAVRHGVMLVTPKIESLINTAKKLCPNNSNEVALYCWRGGDRSSATAHLLEQAGLIVHRLEGGYKAFRNFVLHRFTLPYKLCVVAGKTGTGKTAVLHALSESGCQILDLEHLACHRGSVFGRLPGCPQPSCEHFENRLAAALYPLCPQTTTWVEDESQKLGKVRLPQAFFLQMRSARAILLEASVETRLTRILDEYGGAPQEVLNTGLERIQKRLGGEAYKHALTLLAQNDIQGLACLLLAYYDKSYLHQMDKCTYAATLPFTTPLATAKAILALQYT